MRRWALHSFVLVVLAGLLALPAFRSRAGNIAVTATGVFLRRTGLEDRFGSQDYTYSEASTTTTGSQSRFSATTPSGSLSSALESSSPLQQLQDRQGQYQLATMASSEAAPKEQGCAAGLEVKASKDGPAEPELPKLSAAEFREYNQLADMMNAYVCLSSPLPSGF